MSEITLRESGVGSRESGVGGRGQSGNTQREVSNMINPSFRHSALPSFRPFVLPSFRLFILLSAALVVGCSNDALNTATAAIADSAGITIVTNTAPASTAGNAWRVADRPTIDIGVVSGDAAYEFFRPLGAVRLSDGRIVNLAGLRVGPALGLRSLRGGTIGVSLLGPASRHRGRPASSGTPSWRGFSLDAPCHG